MFLTRRFLRLNRSDLGPIVVGQAYLWSFVAALILLVVFVAFSSTPAGDSPCRTADDEMAALSVGVSARFVYATAWAIAFMAAGVGGTLLGNINGLNISVSYLGLLVLPAVVLGGLNSVPGPLPAGSSSAFFRIFAARISTVISPVR